MRWDRQGSRLVTTSPSRTQICEHRSLPAQVAARSIVEEEDGAADTRTLEHNG